MPSFRQLYYNEVTVTVKKVCPSVFFVPIIIDLLKISLIFADDV